MLSVCSSYLAFHSVCRTVRSSCSFFFLYKIVSHFRASGLRLWFFALCFVVYHHTLRALSWPSAGRFIFFFVCSHTRAPVSDLLLFVSDFDTTQNVTPASGCPFLFPFFFFLQIVDVGVTCCCCALMRGNVHEAQARGQEGYYERFPPTEVRALTRPFFAPWGLLPVVGLGWVGCWVDVLKIIVRSLVFSWFVTVFVEFFACGATQRGAFFWRRTHLFQWLMRPHAVFYDYVELPECADTIQYTIQ